MIRQTIIGTIDNIAKRDLNKPWQRWMAGVRIFHHVWNRKEGKVTIYRPIYNVIASDAMHEICSTMLRAGDMVVFQVRDMWIKGRQYYEVITFDILARRAWNKVFVDGYALQARYAGADIVMVTDRRGFDSGLEAEYFLDDDFFNPPGTIPGFN